MECLYDGKTYVLRQNTYILTWNPLGFKCHKYVYFFIILWFYTLEMESLFPRQLFNVRYAYKSTFSGHCR